MTYEQKFQALVTSPDYNNAGEADRKNKIGDFMYPFVQLYSNAEHAPKITGMIIDLPEVDLKEAVKSEASLKEKVKEGQDLLNEK